MTTRERPPRTRSWGHAYDPGLHAVPAEFRERWGDGMRRTFTDRLTEARANGASAGRRHVTREPGVLAAAGAAVSVAIVAVVLAAT